MTYTLKINDVKSRLNEIKQTSGYRDDLFTANDALYTISETNLRLMNGEADMLDVSAALGLAYETIQALLDKHDAAASEIRSLLSDSTRINLNRTEA